MELSKYAKKQLQKSKCRQKIKYKTNKLAWKSAFYFFTTYGFFNTAYECKYCECFHLTHQFHTPPKEFIIMLADWFQLSEDEMCRIIYKKEQKNPVGVDFNARHINF